MSRNETESLGEMPDFEHYDGLNHFLANYYPYLTVFCQGNAFISSVLFHFTNYRHWNLLGTIIANLCLPVDIFIFWLEPLGSIGSMVAVSLGNLDRTIVQNRAGGRCKNLHYIESGKIWGRGHGPTSPPPVLLALQKK